MLGGRAEPGDEEAAELVAVQGPGAAPAGELPQVKGVGLTGQAAVPGELKPLQRWRRINIRP